MTNISYIVSGSGRIAAVANGQPYTVESDHPNYKEIKDCLAKQDANRFVQLVDIPKTINTFGQGKVTVVNGVIKYGDREINNSLAKRILWMIQEGFEVTPFVTFLENLMQNPSRRAVTELYNWMERNDIPITTDGCWIGYKYLNLAPGPRKAGEPADKDILIDVHSNTIRQWKGKVVEVPRNEVDEDWGKACSEGLHIGASSYSFSGTVRVLVKVNPKDVVSVPADEAKCRVCKYEIVDVYKADYATPVVGPNGESVTPTSSYKAYDEMATFAAHDDADDAGEEDDVCEYCGKEDCFGECLDESEDE